MARSRPPHEILSLTRSRYPVFSIRRPAAFTLLELLLTLAVLAATAAVVLPQLGGLIGDRRLVRAADQLRIEMTRLRVEAMREGKVMMLEGAIEGGSLRVRPYLSMSDATESMETVGPSALLSGAKQDTFRLETTQVAEPREIELPENVVFAGLNVVSSVRAAVIEQADSGVADSGVGGVAATPMATSSSGGSGADVATAGWSRPILFYPDGSTSTATVTLRHETMGSINVRLRGITGDTTIGEVTQ